MAPEETAVVEETNVTDAAPVEDTAPAETSETNTDDNLFADDEVVEEERPDWLPEKFKDVESLAKSYTELEKKFMEKREIPEQYDFAELTKDTGLVMMDEEAAVEFASGLKEQGFTNDQVKYMFNVGAQWLGAELLRHTPEVDKEAERGALEQEWGDQAPKKYKEAVAWAESTLGRDVLTKPLAKTAAGVKLLESMMRNQKGPQPLRADSPEPQTAAAMDAEIEAHMSNPKYWAGDAVGEQLRAKVQALVAKMEKAKG